MNKTAQKICVALVLLVTTVFPLPARAQGTDDLMVSAEPVVVTELGDALGNGVDNDALLAGYIEQRFAAQLGEDGESTLSVQSAGERLTGNTAIAYEYVKGEVAKIAAGERTSTEIVVPLSLITDKTQFSAADLGLDYIYDSDWNPDIPDALDALVDIDFAKIGRALLADSPYEMYWYDKTAGSSFVMWNGYGATYSYETQAYELTLKDENNPFIRFSVADAYAASAYEVATPVAGKVDAAVANAADIVAQNADKSTYEQLVAYKDAICGLVAYNTDAANNDDTPYGDPWQLVYVFDGDATTNVVCEGYAKAFKYLCDLSDLRGVECLLVTGVMSGGTGAGGHMWNVVKMYDGKSYLVDVTNCDEDSVGEPDKLFMRAPTSGTAQEGYTYVFDAYNQTSYYYDDGVRHGATSMRDLYYDDELTLADTDFDPAAEQTAENLSAALVTVDDVTYSGEAQTPAPKVVLGTKTLVAGTDYTVAYADNVDAGVATVTITGTGDYTGTATGTFVIVPKDVTPEVDLSSSSFTYTGAAQRPQVTCVTADGIALDAGDYEVTYAEGCIEAGSYAVTVTLTGNYTGSATAEFVIDAATLQGAVVTPAQECYTYDGTAHEPAVTVLLDGAEVPAEGYTVAYAGNTNAGTATITVTGSGNYAGIATGTFVITARALEDEMVVLEEASFVYDGSAKEPTAVVTVDGMTLVADTDYTVAYADNVDAGTATVTVTGMGNYAGEVELTFAIAKAPQVITLAATEVSIGRGCAIDLGAQASGSGALSYLSSDESVAGVGSDGWLMGSETGTCIITVLAAETDNYEAAQVEVRVTITGGGVVPEPDIPEITDLSGAVVSLAQECYTYDGTAHEPAVTVLLDGVEVPTEDYTVAYADNVDAGTATVTVTGMGDYAGGAVATFTIEKAVPVITVSGKTVTATKTVRLGATASEGAGALTYESLAPKVATVDANGVVKSVSAGTARVRVSCAETDNFAAVSKEVTISVKKAANPMSAKAKKATVALKASNLKKKAQTVANLQVKGSKAAMGTLTYKSASAKAVAKKFKVNAKTGKVTVAKGTKKGTYTVKVKVTAKGNGVYAAKTVTVTFKVKVK